MVNVSNIKVARMVSKKVKMVKAGKTVFMTGEEVASLKKYYGGEFVLQGTVLKGAGAGFLVSK